MFNTFLSSAFRNRWVIIASLIAIFSCGMVIGSIIARRSFEHGMRSRLDPTRWEQRIVSELSSRLQLTTTQRTEVTPIVRETSEKVLQIRQRGFQETDDVIRASTERVKALLSPDQRVKLDEWIAHRRERAEHWMRRGGHGGMVPHARFPSAGAPNPSVIAPDAASPSPR